MREGLDMVCLDMAEEKEEWKKSIINKIYILNHKLFAC